LDDVKFFGVRPPAVRSEYRVVDADVHLNDTPQALAPYCEMPWRLSLEHLGRMPHRYLDIPGFAPGLKLDPPIPGGQARRSTNTPEEMREELDLLGIDDGILIPDNMLVFATLPNADYATALSHAYNRWLVAEWVREDKGLHGCIIACPQNPADSAREIERYAGTPGVVGVFLPTAGVTPLWGHRQYDPILRAAEECGFPVVLHSVGLVSTAFPHNQEQYENHFGRHVINHVFGMMANLSSLMHTGVPARYPNLRIVFTEAGIAWVPSMMWRMDRDYNEYRRLVPFLKERPSEYMKRQMWFCTQPFEECDNPAHIVEILHQFDGANRVLFASDWPHHDFDHPSALLKVPFTPEERRNIMGQNAVELFKLPALTRATA
jgi:uncharacterized protein